MCLQTKEEQNNRVTKLQDAVVCYRFITLHIVKTFSPLLESGSSRGFHKLPSWTHLVPTHYCSVIIYRRLGAVSVFV